MPDDYTPSMGEIREEYAFQYLDAAEGRKMFDRAIAAHDAELRAEIAAAIRADLQEWLSLGTGEDEAAHSTAWFVKGSYERAATIAEGQS